MRLRDPIKDLFKLLLADNAPIIYGFCWREMSHYNNVCVPLARCIGTPVLTSSERQWSISMVAVCATDPPLRMVSTMTCSLVDRSESKLLVLSCHFQILCTDFPNLFFIYVYRLYYIISVQEFVKRLFHRQKDD